MDTPDQKYINSEGWFIQYILLDVLFVKILVGVFCLPRRIAEKINLSRDPSVDSERIQKFTSEQQRDLRALDRRRQEN